MKSSHAPSGHARRRLSSGPKRVPARRSAPGRAPWRDPRAAGWVTLALVILLTLLHLAALGRGPGSLFGDDFALYVIHARNLAEGQPYGETGYIFNPLYPWFSPRTYPPGFPLLLAPVYAAAGLDFRAMKVVVVLSLAGVLLLLARFAARERLPPAAIWATVLLVGLHPFIWGFRENVLPDLPFTFFALLALVPIARAGAPGATARERLAWCAAAVPAIALATVTRTIGVVLAPTLLTVLLLRSRRPGWALAACAGATAALLALRLLLFPIGSGYLRLLVDLVSASGPLILVPSPEHVRQTGYALSALWYNGYSPAVAKGVALAVSLLAAAGLLPRLRRPAAAEVFFVLYLLAVFLWPAAGARYLLPALPLGVLYAVLGAQRIARTGTAGRAVVAAVALAVCATYVGRYSLLNTSDSGGAAVGAHAQALYRYVRAHTAADARFLATNPRALALFTERAAAPAPRRARDSDNLAFMGSAGIGYVVVRAGPDLTRPLVERNPGRFTRVYANPGFALFRVRPVPPPHASRPDTN